MRRPTVKARFLCEGCGKEVPFNVELCPNCGREFRAVKCPVCELEGSPDLFAQGCPSCGYMSSSTQPKAVKAEAEPPAYADAADLRKPAAREAPSMDDGAFGYRRGSADTVQRRPPKPEPKKKKGILPNWVIGWGSFFLLIILVVFLVIFLRS
jgi:hypothetical protein